LLFDALQNLILRPLSPKLDKQSIESRKLNWYNKKTKYLRVTIKSANFEPLLLKYFELYNEYFIRITAC